MLALNIQRSPTIQPAESFATRPTADVRRGSGRRDIQNSETSTRGNGRARHGPNEGRSDRLRNLRAVFGDVIMRALLAILSDSQDMMEQFNKNPEAYTKIMNNDLLPVVYRRCNAKQD